MDLRHEILKEHSKEQCNKIVDFFGKSPSKFDDLFLLFSGNDILISQRAAWPLSYIVIAYPSLLDKYFEQFLDNLERPALHNAVRRASVKILAAIEIPEKFHGRVMHICFTFLQAPREHVAVKAFSITILSKLAGIYPEILPELKLIIKDQLPTQTAAFKSRARKIIDTD